MMRRQAEERAETVRQHVGVGATVEHESICKHVRVVCKHVVAFGLRAECGVVVLARDARGLLSESVEAHLRREQLPHVQLRREQVPLVRLE